MQQSFCSNCGVAITVDTKFCSSCGTAIQAPTSPVTADAQVQKNRDTSFLESALNLLVGPLKNGFVFFAIYFIFMLPTYYLPYVGSNSALLNVASSAAGLGLSPQFWTHVACLFVLVVVTWLRGCVIGKQWITVFPVIAGLFDLTPGLNLIPFVPTIMHVIALIMGVRGTEKVTSGVRVPVLGAAVSAVGAFVVVSGLLYSWAWPTRLNATEHKPSEQTAEIKQIVPNAIAPVTMARTAHLGGRWHNGENQCAIVEREDGGLSYVFKFWKCDSEETPPKTLRLTLSDKSGQENMNRFDDPNYLTSVHIKRISIDSFELDSSEEEAWDLKDQIWFPAKRPSVYVRCTTRDMC